MSSTPTPLSTSTTEQAVRAALAGGDDALAVGLVVQAWGAALESSWLTMARGDAALVERVRGVFHEDLVQGLARFQWRCPLRAWVWIVARNAMRRELKAVARSRGRRAALDAPGVPDAAVRQAAARVHSPTQPWQRTTLRTWIERAREDLDADDALLLVLRVDQALGWRDIARVFESRPEAPDDDETLRTTSARLRKRFTRVVARLRRAAVRDGLLDG